MDRANQANASTAQMVQLGVMAPTDAKFMNVMEIFQKVLPLLGEKAVDEFTIQAQPPPVEPTEGGVPGVASQPGLPAESGQDVVNLNPGGI